MKTFRTRNLSFNEQGRPTEILHQTLAVLTNPQFVYTSPDPRVVLNHIKTDHKFTSYPSLALASPDSQFRTLEAVNVNDPDVARIILSVMNQKVIEYEFYHFDQNLELYNREVFGASVHKVGFKSFFFFNFKSLSSVNLTKI